MIVALEVSNFFSGLTNGTPIFLFNLVRALVEEDPELSIRLLYHHRMNAAAADILAELEGERVTITRTSPLRAGIPRGGWWVPRHPPLHRFIRGVDVFHGGDFLRPATGAMPTVVTIFDLSTIACPEYHTRWNRIRDRWKLAWAVREAERLIAISGSTRDDLVRRTGVASERVDVIPLARGHDLTAAPSGAETREICRRLGIADAPFILAVGTVEPRKNHRRLIEAFERLAPDFPDLLLVIAGGRGWMAEPILAAAANSPARDRIRMLGFTDEQDLRALYRAATVFAYPSLYEGFGLPVLEAMAAGVPVVTSASSSTAEVAGSAALLVDPVDTAQLESSLRRLLDSPALRENLVRLGHAHERTFTWQRTARLTLDSYCRAIAAAGSTRS